MKEYDFTAEIAETAERTIRVRRVSAVPASSAVDSKLFMISGAPKGHEGPPGKGKGPT